MQGEYPGAQFFFCLGWLTSGTGFGAQANGWLAWSAAMYLGSRGWYP